MKQPGGIAFHYFLSKVTETFEILFRLQKLSFTHSRAEENERRLPPKQLHVDRSFIFFMWLRNGLNGAKLITLFNQ